MPRSEPPVVSSILALAYSGLLPSGHWKPSAFPSVHPGGLSCCPRRDSFRGSITRPASSFHPAPYAHCWVCTWMSLLTCWRGFDQVGLELSVLTHWVTITNFMGLHPIPRFRAYLGATSAWFGGGRTPRPGYAPPLPRRPAEPRPRLRPGLSARPARRPAPPPLVGTPLRPPSAARATELLIVRPPAV